MPYDPHPSYPYQTGKLLSGFQALAISVNNRLWLVDGPPGVNWPDFQKRLGAALPPEKTVFLEMAAAWLPAAELRRLLAPSLEESRDEFGRIFTGSLSDLVDPAGMRRLEEQAAAALRANSRVIVTGAGAALLGLEAARLWLELPRAQAAAAAANLPGGPFGGTPWPAVRLQSCVADPLLRQHLANLFPSLDFYVDITHPAEPVIAAGDDLRRNLAALSCQPFRVEPISRPSIWGGQRLKQVIPGEETSPNIGWSYQLVPTENRVVFEQGSLRLHVPFEALVAQQPGAILGKGAVGQEGAVFPVRFNLTDTVGGQDLSLQVHPQPEDAARQLGQAFVEQETYYILHAEETSLIHLGFREDLDIGQFQHALAAAWDEGKPFETETYVNAWRSKPHDVFHIPPGTIHNIGRNNVVLEVMSVSDVHTFRLYDYLRRDAGGLRPVHLERALQTLNFETRTTAVRQRLMPQPVLNSHGDGWSEYTISDPPVGGFRLARLDIAGEFTDDTCSNGFHLLMLAEGGPLELHWRGGSHPLNKWETLLVPAAVGAYRLENKNPGIARVVKVTGIGD